MVAATVYGATPRRMQGLRGWDGVVQAPRVAGRGFPAPSCRGGRCEAVWLYRLWLSVWRMP